MHAQANAPVARWVIIGCRLDVDHEIIGVVGFAVRGKAELFGVDDAAGKHDLQLASQPLLDIAAQNEMSTSAGSSSLKQTRTVLAAAILCGLMKESVPVGCEW